MTTAISCSLKNDTLKKEHMLIKFCLKLGKTGRETFGLLKCTLEEEMMS
jgi:hypothetical protein